MDKTFISFIAIDPNTGFSALWVAINGLLIVRKNGELVFQIFDDESRVVQDVDVGEHIKFDCDVFSIFEMERRQQQIQQLKNFCVRKQPALKPEQQAIPAIRVCAELSWPSVQKLLIRRRTKRKVILVQARAPQRTPGPHLRRQIPDIAPNASDPRRKEITR